MGGMWGLAANIVICVIVSMFTEPIKEEERKQFLSPLSKPDKG